MRKLDLAAIALVLALAISLLLSVRAPLAGESAGDTRGSLRGGGARGAASAVADVASGPLSNPALLPTPTPGDVEIEEDDPRLLDDGTYLVTGSIANRNANFALEIIEVPRIEVMDVDQQSAGQGEVVLESRLIPPGSAVGWSYRAVPASGRPAVAFQRTGLRGRWVLP